MYNQLLRELSLFVTQKEDACATVPQKKKSKVEVSADAERLLRDAVAAFSDARPPTNFVVFEDLSEEISNTENSNVGGRRDAATGIDGPPIFDGSVANATPQTGGAGTILHLACALDEPLCLAFGLAMGADARASHTAFRRLMIHEAACNGSIQCLTLLLELGRQYGSNLNDNDADAKLPPRMTRHARAFELPFLPRRLDRSEVMAPLHMYAYQGNHMPPQPLQTEQLGHEQSSSANNDAPNTTGKKKKQQHKLKGADFLSLLQSFRMYARQVKEGELSELEAARKVLQLAALSESSKISFARSCAFKPSQSQQEHPELSLRNRARNHVHQNSNNSTSDGHGNTPLHWAAFKNETECVSLLLSYGANPNARAYPSGWTPLHDAAYSNSTESVELLIDAGATVDARANSGATPLCFAAQEDSAQSAELLLRRGADLAARCAGGPVRDDGTLQPQNTSRFSGYTPLHYCAHYNAKAAARILLRHPTAKLAMEIPDLNDRLPIHVAVARGSSAVLRELLHAGARVVTRSLDESSSSSSSEATSSSSSSPVPTSPSMAIEPSTPRHRAGYANSNNSGVLIVSTPVSSPVLRSMIPSQPVTSSKPWNCLTQKSIDECKTLIHEAEQYWSPTRNHLFTPADRRSVLTLLMTGKRLEQSHGLFFDLWPQVLSFCGRGWFDPIDPSHAPTVVLVDPLTSSPSSALYYSTKSHDHEHQQEDSATTSTENNNMESSYDDSLSLPTL
ncbi:hypothetical protein ACA910_009673 [Epithemia clementina (nom. ined.)]